MHQIFKKEFSLWWAILFVLVGLKIFIFGISPDGIYAGENSPYKHWNIFGKTFGILFSAVIFSMPIYGIVGLVSKKWGGKTMMITISILTVLAGLKGPINL